MRLRTSLGDWTAALLATLGLSPLSGCGGTVTGQTDRTEPGGPARGNGGASAGGMYTNAGGNVSSGGYFGGDGAFGTGGGFVSAGGASTGGVEGVPPPCRNPSPLLGPDGNPTGFVTCAGGGLHREEKRDCASIVPRASMCPGAVVVDGGSGTFYRPCSRDTDCSSDSHEFCTVPRADLGIAGCVCMPGCVSDADCLAGQICVCGDPVGQCLEATCTANGDCTGTTLCLSHLTGMNCPTIFACQTSRDNCIGDSDCPNGWHCNMVNGVRSCSEGSRQCISGRPFLVSGHARVADVARRRDWSSFLSPCLDGLDESVCDTLAAHFTEVALTEHASIAAFARFALEIMSLGAPAELVVGAHQAMADETVHARDAFALASAYAGRPVGPGKLDVGAALSSRSPLDIVRTTILEGCIGETVAAVEAAEALAHSTDPAVREALARVTVDETRHAELAWRFVQWVLMHGEATLRATAASVLVDLVVAEAAAARIESPDVPRSETTLLAHGMVGNETRSEIRRRVTIEVVLPCARALVAEGQDIADTVAGRVRSGPSMSCLPRTRADSPAIGA